MAFLLAKTAGPQAFVLVDTGHHYQSQNIEQIVAWLLHHNMLGGFHFNHRRYADGEHADFRKIRFLHSRRAGIWSASLANGRSAISARWFLTPK